MKVSADDWERQMDKYESQDTELSDYLEHDQLRMAQIELSNAFQAMCYRRSGDDFYDEFFVTEFYRTLKRYRNKYGEPSPKMCRRSFKALMGIQ